MHVTLHACVVYQPSSGFLFPCVLHQRHLQGNENLALPAASLPCSRFDSYHHSNPAQCHGWWSTALALPGAKKKSNRKCLVWMRVCNCNLAESKHGELEQNTYLNAVHWA